MRSFQRPSPRSSYLLLPQYGRRQLQRLARVRWFLFRPAFPSPVGKLDPKDRGRELVGLGLESCCSLLRWRAASRGVGVRTGDGCKVRSGGGRGEEVEEEEERHFGGERGKSALGRKRNVDCTQGAWLLVDCIALCALRREAQDEYERASGRALTGKGDPEVSSRQSRHSRPEEEGTRPRGRHGGHPRRPTDRGGVATDQRAVWPARERGHRR
jgi:hypothetical protein